MSDTFRKMESIHDRIALVIGAMRGGLTEDGTRGAVEILEGVRRELEELGRVL